MPVKGYFKGINMACILIVEDSPTQADQLSMILESQGYETVVSNSAEDALSLLGQGISIEAVVADVIMPGLSGYEFCRTLRDSDTLPDLPVLLLTATKDHREFIRSFQSGADAFLTKPYDPRILLSRLETILEEREEGNKHVRVNSLVQFQGKSLKIDANVDHLLNMLVTSIEDVSETNALLEKSRTQLESARQALAIRANILSSQLAATESSLNIRKDAIEALDTVILILERYNNNFIIMEANKATEDLTGYLSRDLIGCDFSVLLKPDARAAQIREIVESVDDSGAFNKPMELHKFAGHSRYCSVNIIAKSERNRYVCVLTDITGSYSISQAMEVLTSDLVGLSGDDYFQKAVENLSDILDIETVVISQLDKDSRGEKVHHIKAVVEKNKTVKTLSYSNQTTLYQRLLNANGLMVETGASEIFPDSDYLKNNRIESILAEAIIGSEGVILGHIVLLDSKPFQNIPVLKEVLRIFSLSAANTISVEQSRRRYYDLFHFAPDPMFMVDEFAKITMANELAATMFGYSEDELLGQFVGTILPKVGSYLREKTRQDPGILRSLKIREDAIEMSGMTRDKREIPLELSANSLETASGPKILIACRDLTERRQQEADHIARLEAEKASEQKSAFLATMSHEIRTPINGVIGCADLLARQSLQSQQSELVETIQDSARNLLQVIDDILDFSKIEAGQLTLNKEAMSVRKIAETVSRSLRMYAFSNGVRLTLFTHPDLPLWIKSDSVRITQIITNLVANAIKFSKRPGKKGNVALRVEKTEDHQILFTVRDDGIGIKSEDRAKLFRPFSQAETTTSRKFGGTGLGLSICKRLVEMLRGTIDYDSVPGHGTRFWVKLPIEKASGYQQSEHRLELKNVNCLVVADNRELASDWVTYLEYSGASCRNLPMSALLDGGTMSGHTDNTVMIVDDTENELMDFFRSLDSDGHCPIVVLESGRRRQSRYLKNRVVCLDVDGMNYQDLILATAMALGREAEIEGRRVSRVGNDTFLPPDRDEAIARNQLILVAEDNEVNQKVIRRQLAAIGYASDVVNDGRQALYAWQKDIYSLVITDLHMPELDGYELARSIRESEGDQRIPIIALTANALKGEKDVCLRSGMDDYLSKPVSLDKLEEVIEQWLPGDDDKASIAAKRSSTKHQINKKSIIDVDVLKELIGDDGDVINSFVVEYKTVILSGKKELLAAIQQQDMKLIKDIAHRLKSSARTMGSFRFADMCEIIERDATDQNDIDMNLVVEEAEILLGEIDFLLNS